MFDICLIHPPTIAKKKQSTFFPLALVTLGGMLKKNDFSAKLIDFDLMMHREDLSDKEFLLTAREHLQCVKAKIFGITTICSNFAIALLIAKVIKELHPSAKVILGGPQASLVPLETLDTFPDVDLIVCGEGEETLIELLNSDFKTGNLKKIAGLAIRVDGKSTFTEKRKLIENLDDLPLPDFSLLCIEDYFGQEFIKEEDLYAGVIEAGRGCPFECIFCSTSVMWARKFRTKSPSRIFHEMHYLYSHYGIKKFGLMHDNFTADPIFLEHFCNFFQTRNIFDMQWKASSRADCLNEETLKKMADSGCRSIFFGIESTSPRIQNLIRKNLDLEKFIPLLKCCIEYEITTSISFMLGFPEETIEDMEMTLASAVEYCRLGTKTIVIHKVGVLAGTQLFKQQLPNLIMLDSPGINCDIFPKIPEISELLIKYPNLFSYAYSIPNSYISEETINGLINLFHAGVWNYPDAIYKILKTHQCRPLNLWKEWQLWCSQNYGDLPESYDETTHRFPYFVQELNSRLQIIGIPFFYTAGS